MEIKPIRTKRDYEAALRKIEVLMTARRGTPERDRLDVLATLVEAYEAKHFRLDLPDAVAINLVIADQASRLTGLQEPPRSALPARSRDARPALGLAGRCRRARRSSSPPR